MIGGALGAVLEPDEAVCAAAYVQHFEDEDDTDEAVPDALFRRQCVTEHAVEIAWGTAVLGGVRDRMGALILIQASSVGGVDVVADVDFVCVRGGGGKQADSQYACCGGEGHRDLSRNENLSSVHH
jgi:hypothetical protein